MLGTGGCLPCPCTRQPGGQELSLRAEKLGCMVGREAVNPASLSGRAEKGGLCGRFLQLSRQGFAGRGAVFRPGPGAALRSGVCASRADEVQM